MILLLALASAAEPGAAIGVIDADCMCMEIESGAHADRFTTTWRPLTDILRIEHLEFGNQPLLSAVLAVGWRVSIARRDGLEEAAGRITSWIDVPLVDQHTGFACPHVQPTPADPAAVGVWLQLSSDHHLDASAYGAALRARSGALRGCLSSGDEAFIELGAKASGKASANLSGGNVSNDAGTCVVKALKGLKADVSVKAAGSLTFAIEVP